MAGEWIDGEWVQGSKLPVEQSKQQPRALFSMGTLCATQGIAEALSQQCEGFDVLRPLFLRHSTGDWGDVSPGDANLNNISVGDGTRIVSSYKIFTHLKVWVITEADRSVTTILMPEEY